MAHGILVDIDTWIIAVAVLGLGIGVSQVTFRLGRRWRASLDGAARTNLNIIEVALLSLLGLLLAFSLSMSVTRFDTRRTLMVDEVNAIDTAWQAERDDRARTELGTRIDAARRPGRDNGIDNGARQRREGWQGQGGCRRKLFVIVDEAGSIARTSICVKLCVAAVLDSVFMA